MIYFARQTLNWLHLLTLFMTCVTLISTTSNSHAQNNNLISLPLILKKDSNFSPYNRYIDVAGLRILALDEVSEKLQQGNYVESDSDEEETVEAA